MGMHIVRGLFAVGCALIGLLGYPGGLMGLGLGLFFSACVIALEVRLHAIQANVLMGGVVGSFIGLVLAIGCGVVARGLDLSNTQEGVIQGVALLVLTYLGMVIGALKGEKGEWWLPWKPWAGNLVGAPDKVLDTSVLIDGRILEVAEAGFLEGRLVVPQFVLHELQAIADSSDELKRSRGKRGLEILRTLQEEERFDVELDSRDFPRVPEVDLKLVELAAERDARVVTNDTNLAKVVEVRGLEALNINELATAMKPTILPGESMSVMIVKEGKEPGQGVGYLDDGTMVVVESAAGDRGHSVRLEVTSAIQTSAGKMVFGRRLSSNEAQQERRESALSR